jgi:hypothetical protein
MESSDHLSGGLNPLSFGADCRDAVVADPAFPRNRRFLEIFGQEPPSTYLGGGELPECPSIGNSNVVPFRVVGGWTHDLGHEIASAVEKVASRNLPIPSSAANLLDIARQVAGETGVNHQPDIRFIEPHAQGDRCRSNLDLIPHELVLRMGLSDGRKPCMERGSGDSMS